MALQTFLREYMQMPIVTRMYTTACVVTTIAVHLELVSPFQLYYNPTTVIKSYQVWRLLTTFLYFGQISFSFFFNLVFTYRYCRMLEEGSFRNRSADFVMMFLFGGVLMLFFGTFVNLLFLGQAFTIMLVYVWARRNPLIRMNFFGIFEFEAPYLPYVLLGFSVVLGNTVVVDVMGMVVGHIYYFFEDVFPNSMNGYKLIRTPQFLKNLLDEYPEDPDYTPLEEDRPGGFNWGAAAGGGIAAFAQNINNQGAGAAAAGGGGGGGAAAEAGGGDGAQPNNNNNNQ